MQEKLNTEATQPTRRTWIEPEVRPLDVRATAFRPHAGSDGDVQYPDCSRS